MTIDKHAHGEKVDAEIDAFVAKRDAERRRAEGEQDLRGMAQSGGADA